MCRCRRAYVCVWAGVCRRAYLCRRARAGVRVRRVLGVGGRVLCDESGQPGRFEAFVTRGADAPLASERFQLGDGLADNRGGCGWCALGLRGDRGGCKCCFDRGGGCCVELGHNSRFRFFFDDEHCDCCAVLGVDCPGKVGGCDLLVTRDDCVVFAIAF